MSHCSSAAPEVRTGGLKVVLVGNPNVGKSSVFHALTGVYVEVSNYPGTTLDVSSGKLGEAVLLDTPGIYGVSSFSDEERVAREIIVKGDAIINVVDAAHIDRDLFLTLQLIEMGYPTVVALNMMDEAQAAGLVIDVPRLASLLGVEVVPLVAVRRQGIFNLRRAAERAWKSGQRPNPVDILISEDDADTCRSLGVQPPGTREEVYIRRRERADEIVAQVVTETDRGASFATRLGRWTLEPVAGTLILAGVLVFMYYALGVGIAQWLVGITEGIWFGEYIIPWVTEFGSRFVAPDSLLGEVLIGEFGLLTMTVSYLLGLLLPLVVGFTLLLSAMEDTGYLGRIAVLVDRLMIKVGLNGRAIIPMILGFGCVTMATMTTRLMGTKRERTIATFLLALAIPCSAQLAVIAAMLAPLGLGYTALFVGILAAIYGGVGMVMNRMLPGQSSTLLIDLPPLRLPMVTNVLQKTYLKSKGFLLEAGGLFALGSVAVALLHGTGALAVMQGWLEPVTVGWMGLPREAANAFIMGFVRRDFGAAGLYDMQMTAHQTLVSLVTITLFVPCIASIMMIIKERGRREGIWIWAGNLVVALFVGGVLHRVLFW